MFAALARDFRLAPVTFSLLALSVALFFSVELYRTVSNDPLAGRRTFGSVEPLHIRGEEELKGPFDLWEGPWWRWLRVPASAFHHGGLLHLFFNVSFLWFLGPLVERRMRVWQSLLFWFFTAMIPLLPEFLLEHYAVGLSGVSCAMFGWCLVERHWDPVVAQRVHPGMVQWTWMFLIGCLVATILGVLPVGIANAAHFVGVGYGWLIARTSQSHRGRWGFLAAHAMLPVLIYGLLHPFWNGRYHAYRGQVIAERANSFTPAVPEFREAVRLEPGLPRVWARLADERTKQGDRLGAWRFIIEGLQHNQSNQQLAEGAQRIWRFLTPTERDEARRALEQTFASEAEKWSKRLKLPAEPLVDTPRDSLQSEVDRLKNEAETLWVDPANPSSPSRRGRKPSKRYVDPDAPGSAAEGRTL